MEKCHQDVAKSWHWTETTWKQPGRDMRHSEPWEDWCEVLIQHKFYHFLEETHKSGFFVCVCRNDRKKLEQNR